MMSNFVRVATAVPQVPADGGSAASAVQCIRDAADCGVQLLLLRPCGSPAGSGMQESAWQQLLHGTASCGVLCCMPQEVQVSGRQVLVFCFFQQGQLRLMQPADRYLSSGTSEVRFAGQQVPFGCDVMLQAGPAGVIACSAADLTDALSPLSAAALQGAVLFCCFCAGDGLDEPLGASVSNQLKAAVVCLPAAGGASVFEGGDLLASGRETCCVDVDVSRLRADRMSDTLFADVLAAQRMSGCPMPASRSLEVALPCHDDRLLRRVPRSPFIPDPANVPARCDEIYAMQVSALCRRLEQVRPDAVIAGVSGGLDSTLALLVMSGAMDRLGWPRNRMLGVTMPGFGTTSRTYQNAVGLIKSLGAGFREISIREACLQHFSDIGHDPVCHDVTYENSQARERTQILMDLANACNGLVVGTGDLSELALGWATYNGDHMSMYAVNADLPKTLVRHVVRRVADRTADPAVRRCLYDVLDTPVSPELLPADSSGLIAQKTEDLVGPYELHDFFLYHVLRYGFPPRRILMLACAAFEPEYSRDVVLKWLRTFYRRFFVQQFKRSCMPDGPRVLPLSLSPRGDWCMPSDATRTAWCDELENL